MKRQQKWNLKDGVAELVWPSFRLRIDASTPELGGKVSFSAGAAKPNANEGPAPDQQDADAACFQIRVSANASSGDSTTSDAASSDATEAVEGVETYCRGGDLISRYGAGIDDPIAREIYWRLATGADGLSDAVASIETIYSLQTDLLDSAPQPSVPSVFSNASNRWFQADDTADGETKWSERSWDDVCFAAGEGGGRVACLIGFSDGSKLVQTVYPPDLRGVEISVAGTKTEIHWQLRSDFLEKGVIRRLRLLTVVGGEDSSEKDLLDAATQFYQSELPLTV